MSYTVVYVLTAKVRGSRLGSMLHFSVRPAMRSFPSVISVQ